MPPLRNLIGKRFGLLFVLDRSESCLNGQSRWLCKCDCGNDVIVLADRLLSRRYPARNCGCAKKTTITHGHCRPGLITGIQILASDEI